MQPKGSLAWVIFEVAIVLLATAIAFVWGRRTAMIEQGYNAIGGEYLLLLVPAIYYTGKRTLLDWIADLRERRKGATMAKTPETLTMDKLITGLGDIKATVGEGRWTSAKRQSTFCLPSRRRGRRLDSDV